MSEAPVNCQQIWQVSSEREWMSKTQQLQKQNGATFPFSSKVPFRLVTPYLH